MEVQRGGVGRVPLKSTGHSAPLREGPQYCRPQNQWAPDHEVQKWEQEISDIFQEGKEHKFEEAEILEDSKDFPTHSGIQTPVLNAAMGKTEGKEHKFEEAEILEDSKDFPTHSGIQTPVLNAAMGKTDAAAHPESKLQPMERSTNAQNFLAQGPTQTPDIQPEINKEPTEVSSIKKEIIASDKEFPPLNADLSEQDRPQEIAGEKEIFGRSRQSEQTNVEMPRHGVPLETFIEHGNEGKVPQNIEGKTAQHRDETAPDSGVHVGRALKKEITKPQSDHKFDEANILEDSKQFPAKEHEPDLSVPEETDKEKKEMKEVKGVVGEVKHVAQVVGSKIAHGVENVKEMLTDAVHHLTNTTEAEDKEKDEKEDKKEQTAGKNVRDEYGYNTCA